MQPSLTHYVFVAHFIDRGLTSEKCKADRAKHSINMWFRPRQNWNMGYARLFMVLIMCSSFTTLNPIALLILTKLHNQIRL